MPGRSGNNSSKANGAGGAKRPPRSRFWSWQEGSHERFSATLRIAQDEIIWVWEGPKDQGGTYSQSCYDFLQNGPTERGVPKDILEELRTEIDARGLGKTPPNEIPPALSAAAIISSPSGAWRLWLIGILMVAVPIGAALAMTGISAMVARYTVLLLPILTGLLAVWHFQATALLFASALALGAGIFTLHSWERLQGLGTASMVEITTPAEMTSQPGAHTFILEAPRYLSHFSGEYRLESARTYGAGARESVRVYHVMPMVDSLWREGQPIHAFVACQTTPGFTCLARQDGNTRYFARVPETGAAAYRAAIEATTRRHNLSTVPQPVILTPTTTAVIEKEGYLLRVVGFPLVALLLWSFGFLGYKLSGPIWLARKRSRDDQEID